jgi:hypothetical protein
MPITPDQLKALAPNTPMVLDKKFKDHEPGTVVYFERIQPVQNKPMGMMVAEPGSRAFAVPPESMSFPQGAAGSAPTEQDADSGPDISGPVFDLLATAANMEDEMAMNFLAKYIEVMGTTDVSMIVAEMERLGIPAGQGWTKFQTAQIAEAFYDSMALDIDPLVTAALAAGEAAPAPAASQTAPATTAQPAAEAKTEKAPSRAKKPPETAKVDKASWDATRIGALRILGVLAPAYAESPDTFDADLALAVKMLNAASAAK